MDQKSFIKLEDTYGAHNYKPLDVVIANGSGAWVVDVEGKKYLDCLAAYSALNQGYVHPRVLNVMIEQARKCALTSRAFRNDQLPFYAKELCELTGFEMMLPMNTGAEAVETAVKAARLWGYEVKKVAEDQARIIVFSGNFHGRTTTIVSFSDDPDSYGKFGPRTPGFDIVEYGDIEAVKKAITSDTVAVLIEPIQGEAGVRIPPAGFMKTLEDVCRTNNMLFICDEIQSGLGRTGKLFAHQWEDVHPDLVCLGKALSAGFYPVSAVVGKKEILGLIGPGRHGSTYGGSPLACAIAREALKVLVEEKLIERAAELGEYFLGKLKAMKSPHVKAVRGRGMWYGIDLHPEAGGARRFTEALMKKGLLCKETHKHTIRLAPPLIVTKEDLDWAADTIYEVLEHKG